MFERNPKKKIAKLQREQAKLQAKMDRAEQYKAWKASRPGAKANAHTPPATQEPTKKPWFNFSPKSIIPTRKTEDLMAPPKQPFWKLEGKVAEQLSSGAMLLLIETVVGAIAFESGSVPMLIGMMTVITLTVPGLGYTLHRTSKSQDEPKADEQEEPMLDTNDSNEVEPPVTTQANNMASGITTKEPRLTVAPNMKISIGDWEKYVTPIGYINVKPKAQQEAEKKLRAKLYKLYQKERKSRGEDFSFYDFVCEINGTVKEGDSKNN